MLKGLIFLGILFILTLDTQLVFANTCAQNKAKDVDFRKEFGPIISQGPIGWCYAHVAADLLTVQLKRDKLIRPNERISSAGLALKHNYATQKHRRKEYFKSIYSDVSEENLKISLRATSIEVNELKRQERGIKTKIELLEDKLITLEGDEFKQKFSELEELAKEQGQLSAKMKTYKGTLKAIEKGLERAAEKEGGWDSALLQNTHDVAYNTGPISNFLNRPKEINDLCLDSDMASYDTISYYKPLQEQFKSNIDKAFKHDPRKASVQETCDLAENLTPIFKQLNKKEIYNILNTYLANPLGELFKRSCKRSLKPSKNFLAFKDQPDIIKNIDAALESGSPASISYNADIFFSPELYNLGDEDVNETNHASIVVGKRFNCETNQMNILFEIAGEKIHVKMTKKAL